MDRLTTIFCYFVCLLDREHIRKFFYSPPLYSPFGIRFVKHCFFAFLTALRQNKIILKPRLLFDIPLIPAVRLIGHSHNNKIIL